jgi:hypothetical protein
MSFGPVIAYEFRVDTLAVIAYPHPVLPLVIANFHFDALRVGVT